MSEMQRERDLVLNPNEYAYVLDKTKGYISCVVGPAKMSLSTSDALVVFNPKTKRFTEASLNDAITTFVSAPENWYVTLKNPAKDDKHPTPGTPNTLPELMIGKKVNIKGNVTFALYPGQMAKVIQGHRLHNNQYLLARVYDAESLGQEEVKDEEGNVTKVNKYTVGQILVIKGTDVPFYIPPTGIEVLPVGGYGDTYIRDAVTLEKLEYCILKDEQGNKKYVHGPAVVFPEPDEVFITNGKTKGKKFRAIELSDISGIYVKVISDYKEDGKEYKTGQELFITGKDKMIYYPRPEHAIIDYNGQVVHHAVAIPVGEGRYVLDRMTGNIKMIKGPAMYLPDPRTEVIVRRKLTAKQCELWFPGNREVARYNESIGEDADNSSNTRMSRYSANSARYSESDEYDECDIAVDAGFTRSDKFTQPRTLVLDNKYNGVVNIDIWTGYAINVVSKNGDRKVVTGAQTYLMGYDETLEVLELSTGKPKTTDNLIKTVYLRVDNNKISDLINVQTKDFVDVKIKLSYCVNFLPEYKDKWFSVENYVKYLTDRARSIIKREVKQYNVEEFYANASDIVRDVILKVKDTDGKENVESTKGRLFKENGMFVSDVEVLSVVIDDDIKYIMDRHQEEMVKESLKLTVASKELAVAQQIAEVNKAKDELEKTRKLYKLEIDAEVNKQNVAYGEMIKRLKEEAETKEAEAKKALLELTESIHKVELQRDKEKADLAIAKQKAEDQLAAERKKVQADMISKVMSSIGPDLVAAMQSSTNADTLVKVAEAISPYALANDESVTDVVDKLLRGTTLENLIEKLNVKNLK